MKRRQRIAVLVPVAAALIFVTASASAAEPVLSERVRALIAEKGVEGARTELVRWCSPCTSSFTALEVYVHKKSKYLYVFPRGGRTMWRLGYRGDLVDPERFNREAGIPPDLGPRFMQLLVEKYGGRL